MVFMSIKKIKTIILVDELLKTEFQQINTSWVFCPFGHKIYRRYLYKKNLRCRMILQ